MDSSSRSEPSQEDWDQYDSDQIRRNNLNAAGALWIGGPVDLKEKKMYEADKRRRVSLILLEVNGVKSLDRADEYVQEKAEREKEAAGVTKLKWMYIYNPKTGYMKAHQILLDSGARDGNFVSRQFVDEFGLEPKLITPIPFSQMAGSFICTEEAEVVWTPSPHSGIRSVVQCFVLPANSEIVNPHFGVRFMEKHGRELLDNLEPQNIIAYAAQKRCTVRSNPNRVRTWCAEELSADKVNLVTGNAENCADARSRNAIRGGVAGRRPQGRGS